MDGSDGSKKLSQKLGGGKDRDGFTNLFMVISSDEIRISVPG